MGYVFVIRDFFEIELAFDREVIKASLSEGVTGGEALISYATGKVISR